MADCDEFRRRHPDFGSEPLVEDDEGSEAFEDWFSHGERCLACRDWEIERRLEQEGVDVADWPCVHMADAATFVCDEHADPYECPSAIVIYEPAWEEFRLAPKDPEDDGIPIQFCPWCAVELPESRYGEWRDELAAMGYPDPDLEDVPSAYQSDKWWSERTEH